MYISHKLNEIKQIATKVTILRSGKVISSSNTSKISTTSMAEKMIGKKVKKITKISNYKPKTSVDVGISKFIEWYKDYYKKN